MKKILIWICAAAVLAGAAVAAWGLLTATAKFDGPEPVRIYIPRGSTEQAVADSLRSALGPAFGEKADLVRRLSRRPLSKAWGSFVIAPGTDAWHAGRTIANGMQTPVKLTFNNLRTLPQLAQRVAQTLEADSAAFMQACAEQLPALGFDKPEQYIAAFLPDTYEFYWNAKAADAVQRLANARNRFWTEERRQAAEALGLTPVQVATLASIVEEETAKADEKPKVARLYLNRLAKGMPLQADPTVKFAVGDFGLRRILAEHLRTPSPYNTYLNPGLPPGPIRMASKEGILAVLDAPAHPYLYMCAKEDFSGYHNFAADHATHIANARRYHAALNHRGIK